MRDRKFHFRTISNWLALIVLATLVSACGENQTGDVTPPTVIATSPINTQTGVSVSTTAVTATFSEAINPSTINGTSFLLSAGEGGAVVGVVSYSGVVATYTLSAPLAPNTTYTATITTAVRDLVDNALASNFVWQFTTGGLPDTTPPQVSEVNPVNGATDVPGNRRLLATFSEAIDPASVGDTGFVVTSGEAPGAPVAGTVSVSGSVLTFTPGTATTVSTLTSNTDYTVTLSRNLKDLAGNPLGTDFVWTFRTGATGDATSPILVLTDPFNSETGTATNTPITATFSEPVNPATITASSFTVVTNGTAVAGTFTVSGRSVTFVPSVPLAASTTYTVTVSNTVTDLAGNPLVGSDVANPWTFTTGLALDVTPPFVNLTSPPNGATNVCINSTINARFNESVATDTVVSMVGTPIEETSFIIRDPNGVQVPGTVTYNGTTRIATFRQAANFVPGLIYTATVTSRVTDRAIPPNALDMNAGPVPNPWTFQIGLTNSVCQLPVPLRSLSSFGIVAGKGLTNTAGPTTINADIGLAPDTTCVMCEAPDLVRTGNLYKDTDEARQANIDLGLAFTDAEGRPRGRETTQLTGQTLEPAVYSTTGTMTLDANGILTLDALGDSSAVWIFQVDGDLRFGEDARVVLANGAQAANVFWVVQGTIFTDNSARIGGTLMARTGINFANDAKIVGRVLTFGSARIRRATINLPAP